MTDWEGVTPGKSGDSGFSLYVETNGPDCVAAREGLEPPTLALGKPCSIRLSYRATLGVDAMGAGFGQGVLA